MALVKCIGEFAGMNIYTDDDCEPNEIVLYNYGRIYIKTGGRMEVTNPGRVVLKLSVPPAAPSSDVNDGVVAARRYKNSD